MDSTGQGNVFLWLLATCEHWEVEKYAWARVGRGNMGQGDESKLDDWCFILKVCGLGMAQSGDRSHSAYLLFFFFFLLRHSCHNIKAAVLQWAFEWHSIHSQYCAPPLSCCKTFFFHPGRKYSMFIKPLTHSSFQYVEITNVDGFIYSGYFIQWNHASGTNCGMAFLTS